LTRLEALERDAGLSWARSGLLFAGLCEKIFEGSLYPEGFTVVQAERHKPSEISINLSPGAKTTSVVVERACRVILTG
jgi:hypothetical protein